MYTRTFTNSAYPGASVTYRLLDGPTVMDLTQHAIVSPGGGVKLDGRSVYAAFRASVVDWTEIPLMHGRTSEKFDRLVIDQVAVDFITAWVHQAYNEAFLTEEEIKNS